MPRIVLGTDRPEHAIRADLFHEAVDEAVRKKPFETVRSPIHTFGIERLVCAVRPPSAHMAKISLTFGCFANAFQPGNNPVMPFRICAKVKCPRSQQVRV